MDAQTELQKVSTRNSSLSKLSSILYVIGGISIFAGIIIFIAGLGLSNSTNSYDNADSSNFIALGIGIVCLGFNIIFFGAIGKAVNSIRNYIIADFNIRHSGANVVEIGEANTTDIKSNSSKSEES